MKKILLTTALTGLCFVPAQAAELGLPGEFSANAGFVTEYSFRGLAQSDETIAAQGGFDWSHDSGVYLGVWGSNVDFNDGDEATVEVDLYGGYGFEFKGLAVDIGAIYYAYPGADSSLDYDFWEAAVSVGHDFDAFALSASLNYSPDFFASSDDAYYAAAYLDVPLPHDFSLSAHVGYQDIDDEGSFGVPDYYDWSVGLGYNLEGFDLALTYVDTDLDEPVPCADGCGDRVIFSVSRSF